MRGASGDDDMKTAASMGPELSTAAGVVNWHLDGMESHISRNRLKCLR